MRVSIILNKKLFACLLLIGFYDTITGAVPGQLFRYVVDLATNRFNINLGVGRSGVTLEGDVNVNIILNTDTISKLITPGRLTSDVMILPATSFNIQPSVVLTGGTSSVSFPLAIDSAFLLNNPIRRFAIGVGIATNDRKVTRNLNTTIVLLNTAFLLPVSNFTFAPEATNPKRINFTNSTNNGVTFSWDFGDGYPLSTERTPFRIYDRAGSFNVTLTNIGVAGDAQKSGRTNAVTVN